MTTMKQDPLILCVVLVAGAMLYSRQAKAQALNKSRPLGAGSMPGSVGTGSNQILGGALGAFFTSLGQRAGQAFGVNNPFDPDKGVQYDAADPGSVAPLQDVVNGAIHDSMTGDTSAYGIPTTSDIFESVSMGF